MSAARRRFRFIKEIAEGGFGKVYLAEQLSADGFSRIVAVKLLHAKWSSHDEVVMRTRDEARLLGLIRHQHIVKVEDLTSVDSKCAIVMEYLEGVDLKYMLQYLGEKGLEFPRSALFEIMLAAASALDAAYNGRPLQGGESLRVIHRDIKPSNIFVTVTGGVKVLDFGTARANFAQREAKTQALAFGSQGYMAPERMLGEEDTPAADIFSLGVTLYELLTGASFGRIPPRPNKFLAKVEEKVGSVPLQGDEEWAGQVRETLGLMLSYEPSERPTAAQLVDIFDLLAQNANDMPLRRFCRTMVAEAKANEPELDGSDPLAGRTVDEDVSSAFGVAGRSIPPGQAAATPAPAPAAAPPAPPPVGGSLGLGAPAQQQHVAKAASVPPPAPRAQAPQVSGPRHALAIDSEPHGDVDEPKGGGGLAKILAAVVVLGLLFVVVLGVVGVVALVIANSGGGSAPTEKVADNTPVEPVQPDATAFTGHTISTPDKRSDVKKARTVLTTSAPQEIDKMKISGLGFDFEAEWDGKGELDLGELGEGTYRALISPVKGSTIRNKSFKVERGRKAECRFTFELDKKDWVGSCS